MQANAILNDKGLAALVQFLFEAPAPNVAEAYSAYEEPLQRFDNADTLSAHIAAAVKRGERLLDYAIYYADTKGSTRDKQIKLDPRRCRGKTFRFTVVGWGVFHLQLDFRKAPGIGVRIAVNSEKRAQGWSSTHTEWGSPKAWDWELVEKHARRLIKKMKDVAQPATAPYSESAARSPNRVSCNVGK